MKGTDYVRLSHFDMNGSCYCEHENEIAVLCSIAVHLHTSTVEIQTATVERGFFTKRGLELNKEKGEEYLHCDRPCSYKQKKIFVFRVRCVYSFFRESMCRVSRSVIAGSKHSWVATHRQSRGALPRHPQAIGVLDVSPPLATERTPPVVLCIYSRETLLNGKRR